MNLKRVSPNSKERRKQARQRSKGKGGLSLLTFKDLQRIIQSKHRNGINSKSTRWVIRKD